MDGTLLWMHQHDISIAEFIHHPFIQLTASLHHYYDSGGPPGTRNPRQIWLLLVKRTRLLQPIMMDRIYKTNIQHRWEDVGKKVFLEWLNWEAEPEEKASKKKRKRKKSIQQWQEERIEGITGSDPYMKCVSPLLSPLRPLPNRHCLGAWFQGQQLVFCTFHTHHQPQHHLHSCRFQIAKWNCSKWNSMRMYPLNWATHHWIHLWFSMMVPIF